MAVAVGECKVAGRTERKLVLWGTVKVKRAIGCFGDLLVSIR